MPLVPVGSIGDLPMNVWLEGGMIGLEQSGWDNTRSSQPTMGSSRHGSMRASHTIQGRSRFDQAGVAFRSV